jgi:hypothetical protein
MSVETKTSTGETVDWVSLSIPGNEKVAVGRYEFERTDFYIGILDFLAGNRSIPLANGTITIDISETPKGLVKFGHIQMPYEQFVDGVLWGMQNTGKFAEEFQVPLRFANMFALDALEKQLKFSLPKRNDGLLKTVRELREEHLDSKGIYGLKANLQQDK